MIDDQALLDVFNEVFKSEFTTLDISRHQLREWDSMKHAELIVKMQKKLKIRFKASDIAQIQSLLDIKELISKT